MPDEQLLRAKARDAVERSKLPRRRPDRTLGKPGVGAVCSACDQPTTSNQLAIEVHFSRDGDNTGLDTFHVHHRCFAAWEFERRGDGGVPHQ
jgi:hypothetical protein